MINFRLASGWDDLYDWTCQNPEIGTIVDWYGEKWVIEAYDMCVKRYQLQSLEENKWIRLYEIDLWPPVQKSRSSIFTILKNLFK